MTSESQLTAAGGAPAARRPVRAKPYKYICVCVFGGKKSDSKLLPRNRHEVCAATGSVAVFEVCAGFIDPEGPKSFVESRLTWYVAY